MKTFKIAIQTSNVYVREIQAKDFDEAKKLTERIMWNEVYTNWGASYTETTCKVEEIKETNT
jgi:hypothetical protein